MTSIFFQTKTTKGEDFKKNWCRHCDTMQSKIMRHMVNKHRNTPEIQQYLHITHPNGKSQKKLRKEAAHLIINRSNECYNKLFIGNNRPGRPIVAKNSKNSINNSSHVICSLCGGLVRKENFALHSKACRKRQRLLDPSNTRAPHSVVVCSVNKEGKYKILFDNIINKYMNRDNLTHIVCNNELILEFGRRFLKSHMNDNQKAYVSSKLRTLADLFHRLQKLDSTNIKTFEDCVDPKNFSALLKTVMQWSCYDESTGICKIGSVPRRLCSSLKICSGILWTQAIQNPSLSKVELDECKSKYKQFMSLMKTEWSLEVNTVGDKSIKTMKITKVTKMPDRNDMIKFFHHMTNKITEGTEELNNTHEVKTYTNLAKAVIGFLVAFNGKRPSEVSYAKVENYATLTQSIDSKNGNNLGVFTVAASKNDVLVPVIVPHFAQAAITALLNHRTQLRVQGNLIFSDVNGKAIHGSKLLNEFCAELDLNKPQFFTANGLRHYWATESQKDPNIKKHMPKFLGHSLNVHQKFYEMPSSDIHLQVIGPMLVKEFLPQSQIQSIQPSTSASTYLTSNCDSDQCFGDIDTGNTSDDYNGLLSEVSVKNMTPPKSKRKLKEVHSEDSDNSSSSDNYKTNTPKRAKIKKRNNWVTPERQELMKGLPKTMLGLEQAGPGKIKDLWSKSSYIKENHNLQTTRIEVSKYYTKKKKLSTPDKKFVLKCFSSE